jgi:hypothetical protein
MTTIGLEAAMPVSRRKTQSEANEGATALASVQMQNAQKLKNMTHLRPYVSLSGPNTSGPTTYPIRYVDMGKGSCWELVV